MKVSIRKSKYQKQELSSAQLEFAAICVGKYIDGSKKNTWSYTGKIGSQGVACDVYRTKTQVSVIVWYE